MTVTTANQPTTPISANSQLALLKLLLKAVGLKVTASRLAVLAYFYDQFLQGNAAALSHAELVERLPLARLDKVTIYRNLNDLAQANLLLKQSLGDTLWRYSYHAVFCENLASLSTKQSGTNHPISHHLHAHPHFVCTQCSQLACLSLQAQEIPAAWALQINKIEEITVRGICQDCQPNAVGSGGNAQSTQDAFLS
jgi:Fur family ferric uptake transcriptional regulator